MATVEGKPGFVEGIRLGTEVVLARARLSPQALARGRESGRMDFHQAEDGRVLLEAGGVAVAEGRLVRRRGRAYLKVLRLFSSGETEVES